MEGWWENDAFWVKISIREELKEKVNISVFHVDVDLAGLSPCWLHLFPLQSKWKDSTERTNSRERYWSFVFCLLIERNNVADKSPENGENYKKSRTMWCMVGVERIIRCQEGKGRVNRKNSVVMILFLKNQERLEL